MKNKYLLWAVMTAFNLTENEALKKMRYGSIMSVYKELEELTGIKAYLWRDYAKKPLSKHMVTAIELIQLKKENARQKLLLEKVSELFKKSNDSHYVIDVLSETIFYDNTECDGHCLWNDIKDVLGDDDE